MGLGFDSLSVFLLICVLYVIISLSDNVKAKKVDVVVYYETHCPYCIDFFRDQLRPTVLEYASNFNLYLLPYGNAKTYEEDGVQKIKCQHGEIECYCNKLHACAIDEFRNNTKAALFTTCLMNDSYEETEINYLLTTCSTKFNVSSTVIKKCANSQRGLQLVVNNGQETRLKGVRGVPYVTYNGVHLRGNFNKNLCKYQELENDEVGTRKANEFCSRKR